MKSNECPDLVMLKPYSEVDLNETPIVVLGCKGNHFFTAQTLDGMIGMNEVYEINPRTGDFVGLKDNPQLAAAIPQCPTCRNPISQYITQRYNRLINRAVIDEMSKRFMVDGQRGMMELGEILENLEHDLKVSQKTLIPQEDSAMNETGVQVRLAYVVAERVSQRYQQANNIEKNVRDFQRRTNDRHKPAYKLHEATVYALKRNSDISESLATMDLNSRVPSTPHGCTDRDQRITLGARMLCLNLRRIVLNDKFEVYRIVTQKLHDFASYGILQLPTEDTMPFLADCFKLIEECNDNQLPKLAVEATLYYAQIVNVSTSTALTKESDRTSVAKCRRSAKDLLQKAHKLCEHPFNGASVLSGAVESLLRLLGKEFYEEVTKAELDAIKLAMVSGRGGIATHSGHWYNCPNGHPVRHRHDINRNSADPNSSLLASAVCLWKELDAPSAEQPLVGAITLRSPALLVPLEWRVRFMEAPHGIHEAHGYCSCWSTTALVPRSKPFFHWAVFLGFSIPSSFIRWMTVTHDVHSRCNDPLSVSPFCKLIVAPESRLCRSSIHVLPLS